MNAKLAKLIAIRHIDAERLDADARFLARTVFPDIASQAYRGLTQAWIHRPLNDDMVATLRQMGYVVRRERNQQHTTVEWCDQIIFDENSQPKKVSPAEYNAHWARYQDLAARKLAVVSPGLGI